MSRELITMSTVVHATRTVTLLALLALLAFLFSCGGSPAGDTPGGGGGGGIGGTGVAPLANGISQGTISGFGSVFLNGRKFDTDQAQILINNQPASIADLAVGMSVSAEVNYNTGTASKIEYYPSVIGRVESINGGELTVLGQTIVLSGNGVFEGLSQADLNVGIGLEISGARDANDAVIATYVARAAANAKTQITGLAAGYGDANTINFGSLVIPFNDNGEFSQLASYEHLWVQGPGLADFQSGSMFTANRVQPFGRSINTQGTLIELEGIVVEDEIFGFSVGKSLAGRPLFTTAATRYEFASGSATTASAFTAGSRVEVEGTLVFAGAISVDKVIILSTSQQKLHGTIDQLQPLQGTLTIGADILYTTDRTRYVSSSRVGGAAGEQSYATLRTGDTVSAKVVRRGIMLYAVEIKTLNVK